MLLKVGKLLTLSSYLVILFFKADDVSDVVDENNSSV